jgi:hypothetical protein
MQTRRLLFFIFLQISFLFPPGCISQSFKEVSLSEIDYQVIGSDSSDRGIAILPLQDIFMLAGHSRGRENDGDGYFVKIKRDLAVLSEIYVGGEGFDFPFSLIETSDNHMLMVGFTNSYGATGLDAWIAKMDTNGKIIWNTRIGGGGDDRAISVVETDDQNYLVVGQTDSWGNGNADGLLLKIDSSGKEIWKKTFGTPNVDRTFSIIESADGNFLLQGLTNANYPGNSDILLIKVSGNGEELWRKVIGSPRGDIAHAMIRKDNNNILLIGYTAKNSYPLSDPLIIVIDDVGNVLAEYTISYSKDIRLMHGFYLKTNKLYCAGYIKDSPEGPSDALLMHFDFENKTFAATRIIMGEEEDAFYYISPSSENEFIALGHSYSTTNKKGDLFVAKWIVN